MAASEPPEPPPRNPDKINASLKQIGTNDANASKSLDMPAANPNPNNNNHNNAGAYKANGMSGVLAQTPTTAPSTCTTNSSYNNTSTTDTTPTTVVDGSEAAENNDAKAELDSKKETTNNGHTVLAKTATIAPKKTNTRLETNEVKQRNDADEDSVDVPMVKSSTTASDLMANAAVESEIKLRQENERLGKELDRLKRLFEYSEEGGAVGGVDVQLSDSNSLDAHSTDGSSSRVERLELELKMAKDQISHLKTERRMLKSDKNDLLAHVKQLCASLQDKEQELRDFIRNFEQRTRESDAAPAASAGPTERDRERWSLLKHAREESDRSLALAMQLNARDSQLQRLQDQLQEARRQLSSAGCISDQESLLSFAPVTPPSGAIYAEGCGPQQQQQQMHQHHQQSADGVFGMVRDRSVCGGADASGRGSSDKESVGACGLNNLGGDALDADSISLVSAMYQYGTPKDCSPTMSPLNAGSFSRSMDVGALSRSVEHLGSLADAEMAAMQSTNAAGHPSSTALASVQRRLQLKTAGNTATLGRTGRGGTWGSISRVFARSRHRSKNLPATSAGGPGSGGDSHNQMYATDCGIGGAGGADCQRAAMMEESYAEKLRLLREASAIPIDRWRASQVMAWMEVALGMPQYSARCAANVKSGKVLLELNDGELETGLGLAHPMHRKKMRLAIEEQRRPEMMRYQTIGQLGHTWVAVEWLSDIGLPQYADSFMHSMVDARMLDTLSKKELEKFLSVTRKFHQASVVHGIHVLRILKYDRQALAVRRMHCENVDADPIVWTNQRFIRWARSIDLGEFADNLKDSGVHGGLVVLEPSFSSDTIATALGIPPSKNIIRRHLATEFDALVQPARAHLGQGIRMGGGSVVPITGPGGLQQHSNAHHHHSVDRRSSGSLRFAAWRGSQGSLYKALGLKTRRHDRPFSGGSVSGSIGGSGIGGGGGGGGNSTSPTPSYSSSSENGIYATIGQPPVGHAASSSAAAAHHYQNMRPHQIGAAAAIYDNGAAAVASVQPPPSHRVSAPPMEPSMAAAESSAMPQYAQHHRRVKSINDIEIVAATPV